MGWGWGGGSLQPATLAVQRLNFPKHKEPARASNGLHQFILRPAEHEDPCLPTIPPCLLSIPLPSLREPCSAWYLLCGRGLEETSLFISEGDTCGTRGFANALKRATQCWRGGGPSSSPCPTPGIESASATGPGALTTPGRHGSVIGSGPMSQGSDPEGVPRGVPPEASCQVRPAPGARRRGGPEVSSGV